MIVECLEYLMAPDNLQQPPYELQLAEAESGGGVWTVQVPWGPSVSESLNAGGHDVHV